MINRTSSFSKAIESLRYKPYIFWSCVLLLSLMSFQNCGLRQGIFVTSTDQNSQSLDSGNGQGYDGLSGNGQGYDGKAAPIGSFYNWNSQFSCEVGGSLVSSYEKKIVLSPAGGGGVMSNNLCGGVGDTANITQVNARSFAFNLKYVEYFGDVFEKDQELTPPPKGFITFVCKTYDMINVHSETGFMIIIRDSKNSTATESLANIEISFGKENPVLDEPFSHTAYNLESFDAEKLLSSNKYYYKYGIAFNLQIDVGFTRPFTYSDGLVVDGHTAYVSAIINNKNVNYDLACFRGY